MRFGLCMLSSHVHDLLFGMLFELSELSLISDVFSQHRISDIHLILAGFRGICGNIEGIE